MTSNNRLYHPYGDANPSTSSSDRPEPIVKQPENDLTLSSSSNPFPNPGQGPLVSGNVPEQMNRRLVQEEPSHSPDRLVEEIHFGKIVSQATKNLNGDLIRAAQFDDAELHQVSRPVTSGLDHKEVCFKILSLWKQKGSNSQKKVADLKVLLTTAGEPDNKYLELINDIVYNFP